MRVAMTSISKTFEWLLGRIGHHQPALQSHKELSAEEVDELTVISAFTASEIKRLWQLFNQLNVDHNGCINRTEMLKLKQLHFNVLGERILSSGAIKTHGGLLAFRDFVSHLSVFAPATPTDLKLRFAFKVYDFDGDQRLGREDLTQLLHALVPQDLDALDDELSQLIVDKTLEEADRDGDQTLNYMEFRAAVAHSDIASKLTIHFE
mmetsp:Transcript_37575/g.62220  ORF Transcript_37575/g.62220 Transcript_37575/m.62220 type:complete len:207 (+) Transcript_37575:138-758(+)